MVGIRLAEYSRRGSWLTNELLHDITVVIGLRLVQICLAMELIRLPITRPGAKPRRKRGRPKGALTKSSNLGAHSRPHRFAALRIRCHPYCTSIISTGYTAIA